MIILSNDMHGIALLYNANNRVSIKMWYEKVPSNYYICRISVSKQSIAKFKEILRSFFASAVWSEGKNRPIEI